MQLQWLIITTGLSRLIFRFHSRCGEAYICELHDGKRICKKRLETGISFTEFTYQLVQGYDFYWLYKNHQCKVQMGGSDQWGIL
ncbi:MAG: hypothetical protein CM15mP65_17680 [Crocinitomicaceae bacterium]|nr:MAG: hypothetical protein CM15mP65_17680 [Crocinitomicaceae bacterium]